MEDKECRVCRDIGTSSHPLYAPCRCNGSILYCHQDCLQEWLKRSNKNKCELCHEVYIFQPKYSPNTPSILPIQQIIIGTLKLLKNKIFPTIFRLILFLCCWVGLVPFLTSVSYQLLVFPNQSLHPSLFHAIYYLLFYNDSYLNNIINGILLTALIILTFLLLVRLSISLLLLSLLSSSLLHFFFMLFLFD